jgi:hypothetical protein
MNSTVETFVARALLALALLAGGGGRRRLS